MEEFTPKPVETGSPADKTAREDAPDNFWVGVLKQVVPLVAVLVIVKLFIADIFVIPTGSMEPTLHGRDYSGDRIFATEFDFRFRNPKRWEVFVFKYPGTGAHAGENYIKRCIGLPGEDLAIVNGDIFTRTDPAQPAVRQVKPDSLQRKIWLPVYRDDLRGRKLDEFGVFWGFDRAPGVKLENGVLAVDSPDGSFFRFQPQNRFSSGSSAKAGRILSVLDRYIRRQSVTYRCPQCGKPSRQTVSTPQFFDRCGRCGAFLTEKDVTFYDFFAGYPEEQKPPSTMVGDRSKTRSGWHHVRDLRWLGKTRFLRAGTVLAVELREDRHLARAEFTVDAAGQGAARLFLDGNLLTQAPGAFTLPLGRWAEMEFYRCDGEYRAFVDGRPVFCLAPEGHTAPADMWQRCRFAGAGFGVSGAAEFAAVRLDRDIHYFRRDSNPVYFRLAAEPGEFMAMGDNCPASNDSRDWGMVPRKNLVGPAWLVWWPLDAVRVIY